ncbi:helix-turn-helix transcriptional regulator [Streptomyces sp. NPDC050738]|uniref:helix-turn-helix domain-containing protein n=1 Tax=Streptomyces sp. NPDC050738 TaxID=3154744 RepID=UPI00341F6DDE
MLVDPLWNSLRVRALVEARDSGGLVRVGREHRGWTQTDLAMRLGYSASTVCRLEKARRVRDLTVLQAAAGEVGVPEPVLSASLGLSGRQSTNMAPPEGPRTEEDPLRRRTLLAAAGLVAPAQLLVPLDDALASMPDPSGSPVPLDARIARARANFDAGQHAALLKALPALLGDAQHAARSRDDLAYARLSSCYSLTTEVLLKLGRYERARLAADRAAVYADVSGSPLAAAAAARELSMVLRHQDQPAAAQRHILDAVARIEATGLKTDAQASAYAQMLCTTAYTAAVAHDRAQALDLIRDATRAARDLPDHPPAGRLFPVTPASVTLYSVGVHWALGDAGSALEAGRALQAGQFPTAERKGRMHTDLARSWWQLGKPEQTTAALLAAVRVSPSEVRDRPAIRGIVSKLRTQHPRTPGVQNLVDAVGFDAA